MRRCFTKLLPALGLLAITASFIVLQRPHVLKQVAASTFSVEADTCSRPYDVPCSRQAVYPKEPVVFGITHCCGLLNTTLRLLANLNATKNARVGDVLIAADAEPDFADGRPYRVFNSDRPRGVTFQWNAMYKHWLENTSAPVLIIANNDILLPPGCVQSFVDAAAEIPEPFMMSAVCYGIGCGVGKTGNQKLGSRGFPSELPYLFRPELRLAIRKGVQATRHPDTPQSDVQHIVDSTNCMLNDRETRRKCMVKEASFSERYS